MASVDTAGIKIIQGGEIVGPGSADSYSINILETHPVIWWHGSVVESHHSERHIIEVLEVPIKQLTDGIPPKNITETH